MVTYFKTIQAKLMSQRYAWIREGVIAAKLFKTSGVTPDFKSHEHGGCDCKTDTVFWKDYAFDEYVSRH